MRKIEKKKPAAERQNPPLIPSDPIAPGLDFDAFARRAGEISPERQGLRARAIGNRTRSSSRPSSSVAAVAAELAPLTAGARCYGSQLGW